MKILSPLWTTLLAAPTAHHRLGAPVASARSAPEETRREVGWNWATTTAGLKYVDEELGRGEQPKAGEVVVIEYEGTLLADGRRAELDGGRSPLRFEITQPGDRVPVWQEAIDGMRVGGRRKVLVPPSASFRPVQGDSSGDIEEGETFRMDITSMRIETGPLAALTSIKARAAMLSRARPTALGLVFLVSFGPYFLPPELQPGLWQGGAAFHPLDFFTGGEPALPVDPLDLF